MVPLAELPQPPGLAVHNFPAELADEQLPPFVPKTPAEAFKKLRSALSYISNQFHAYALPHAQAQTNIDTQCTLIKVSWLALGDEPEPFSGNLIDSLTETVERNEGPKPCRTRRDG